MAMQPIDRKQIKHQQRTAKRQQPAMVNRSNKWILPDHRLDFAAANSPRFGMGTFWRRFCDNGWF